MVSFCFATIVSLLCITVHIKSVSSLDLNYFINSSCSTDRPYTQGSRYQTNLQYLLSNLTSNSGSRKFYNFTTGEPPNKIYGLFLCNSIYDNQFCNSCIESAAAQILQTCSNSVNAIVWYFMCMLRYSNQNIFSIDDLSTSYHSMYIGAAKYGKFNSQLANTFLSLFDLAAIGSSELKAATTVLSLESGTILLNPYIDCTPDLTPSDCRSCLNIGLNGSRFQLVGFQIGILVQPSCRLMYIFTEDSAALSPLATGKRLYTALAVTSALAAISSFLFILVMFQRIRKKTRKPTGLEEIESMENLRIEFEAIKNATYNFSAANKLGQGGFGIVYMGTLADGQAVAVKRLSNAAGQGIREFKTEACLAAKLQHRNLVKLYGFCLEGNEMLLVYEFVPNKSLDRILFDPKRGAYLQWGTRYKIIMGIARGLLYLHEDSCPKIIHRDLKPSNILLDGEMNPKIADFGMAKLFGGDQTQGNTSRIGGTFGYMAPEYATTGHFSAKSDIFSYGVIVLEIVSGARNRFPHPDSQDENLLSYAWRLWNKGVRLNFVDSALQYDDLQRGEIERCIHVGLLCTQEDPVKRPNMVSVLFMLNTHLNISLPPPCSPPSFPSMEESQVVSIRSSGIPTKEDDFITELSPR